MNKHELIGKEFKVLSHGSIMLVDYMGSDEEIENAARISYGEGTRPVSETRTLLRYLKRHWHTTPFEMAELKFKIKMPMDVNRQWIRHRTANVNEYSTRYSNPIDDTDTTPVWRKQSTNNKQGSDGKVTEWPEGCEWECEIEWHDTPSSFLSEMEQETIKACKSFYDITQQFGVAKEVSRKHLPLSTYTEIFWKCDLHNIMHFLRLRCDSHAQQEIREYANIMAGICKELFPLSMEAWYDYAHMSRNFSRQEMKILQHVLDREQIRNSGVLKTLAQQVGLYDPNRKSNREYDEFVKKFADNYSTSIDSEFELPYNKED